MDPKVTYYHHEILMGIAGKLLPTLERIVPAAAIVADGQELDVDQQRQLGRDLGIITGYTDILQTIPSVLARTSTQEALFVRAVVGGGLLNLLVLFSGFATFSDDPEFAGDIKRQMLHPYFRLYNDLLGLQHDIYTSTGANITIDGDNAHKAAAYYKTAPLSADVIGTSKAVYALMFSALLVATDVGEVSLDFTARAEGERGFIEVENTDGFLADRLRDMIGKPEKQPAFMERAFAAGMSVHGTTISIPFQVARMT